MSSAQQVPIGLRVGEYEITGFLGEGGMGTVYSGIHPVIGKKVAIKVLSPQLGRNPNLIARFIQEARAVNQIGHPNIIDVFAFGESDALGHYFVMPLLEGESLGERLTRGPIPLLESVAILEKVVEALAAAHNAGIFHRDLKPDNIFLAAKPTGGYVVKVLDFGIAKLNDGQAMTVTKTGVPMGTPMFMSPEQWEGVDVDHRTDIYALGILLHHMVTGGFPFNAPTQVALMRAHCDAEPLLPSQVGGPAMLDGVVARALAKNKELRYQTTLDLFAELQTAVAGGAAPTARATTVQSGPAAAPAVALATRPTVMRGESAGRARWLWLLVILVILGGGIAVGAVMFLDSDETAGAAPDAAAPEPDAAPAAIIDAAASPPIDAAPAVKTVEIALDSDPSNADVIGPDGEILGTTPTTINLPASSTPVTLTLRKSGRKDRVITVRPSKNRRYAAFRLRADRSGTSGSGSGSGSTAGSGSGSGSGTGQGTGNDWGQTGDPFRGN